MTRSLFVFQLALGITISFSGLSLETLPKPPVLRPGTTVSLKEAIQEAEKNNRNLKAVEVNLTIAAERYRSSGAVLLPTLHAGLGYTLYDRALKRTDDNGQTIEVRPRHEAGVSLTARMTLVGPSSWLTFQAARLEREISGLDFEQARQLLLYTVAEIYYQASTAERLIRVYRDQARAIERHLTEATNRYRSGVGELMDVKRAETDLVSVREAQASAIFALEDIRDTLALLLARDTLPLPAAEPEPVPFWHLSPEEEEQPPVDSRWELQIARRKLSLEKKKLQAQYSRLAPELETFFQYDLNLIPPPDASEDRSTWFAGLQLTVPLFDFKIFPEIRYFRATSLQAELELFDKRAKVETESRHAIRLIRQAEYYVETAKTKARLADITLELARIAYKNGTATALMVIDAQRSSQTAHVDYETRRLEWELGKLAYLRSIGQDAMLLGD